VELLDMLVSCDLATDDRAWQIQRFTADGKEFLTALEQLRSVIVARYPEICRFQRPYMSSS
jgi:hypothetical protein